MSVLNRALDIAALLPDYRHTFEFPMDAVDDMICLILESRNVDVLVDSRAAAVVRMHHTDKEVEVEGPTGRTEIIPMPKMPYAARLAGVRQGYRPLPNAVRVGVLQGRRHTDHAFVEEALRRAIERPGVSLLATEDGCSRSDDWQALRAQARGVLRQHQYLPGLAHKYLAQLDVMIMKRGLRSPLLAAEANAAGLPVLMTDTGDKGIDAAIALMRNYYAHNTARGHAARRAARNDLALWMTALRKALESCICTIR